MNLQYIYDDTTSPPTQSVLQYKVDPDTVYVSTDTEQMMVNLTITVFNPTQATVNCQNFQFGIYVGEAGGQLASTSDGVQLTTDQSQWVTNAQVVKQGDLCWFTAAPAQGAASEPLGVSQSFIFHLESIAVNQVEGGTPFMILEVTDQDPNGVQGALSLSKEQGSLAISHFSVIPPTPVSPGTQVNISWDVMGAEYWLLYNTTLSKLLYDSRKDSPPQTSWQDTPEAWTEYELIAYAGQIFTFATAVAQVTNPRFLDNYPPTANPTAVDSGAASTLSWQTADAQYVMVTGEGYQSGQITPDANGNGQVTVNPTLTNTYTVTPYGGGSESGTSAQVTVSVNPPTITSFGASPNPFERGQAVMLSWEVESVTALTLNPEGANVLGQTNHQVYPVGRVTYQPTAEGQGPPVKSAPLTVTQLLEIFLGEYNPRVLVYDGTYVWVVNNSDLVTRLRAVDGSNQGTFTVGRGAAALAYDRTYIWVANSCDNNLTRLLAIDGSNQGTFPVGPYPYGIAYDGTFIWVANGGSNTVTRLRATDGSNQGTFLVGPHPTSLAYDGTSIWVASRGDNTVTRIRLSDWPPPSDNS